MPMTTIGAHTVHVDDEGFLTQRDEWDDELAGELATRIGIALDEQGWGILRFLRADSLTTGETPTLRRVTGQTGVPVKELFRLFPGKPAKKMAYVAGLPKPRGCV